MKLHVEYEQDEIINSFSYAKAFYEACNSIVDVKTVAKMMLLEADNECNRSESNEHNV